MSNQSSEFSTTSGGEVQPQTTPYRSQSANGLAVTSLILGILSFLSGWFFMGIVFGTAAVVIGIVGARRAGGKGLALAGIITGGIGALSGAIFTTVWIVALMQVGSIPSTLNKLNNSLMQQNAAVKAQINAKKDFSKGEVGIFGALRVKVNSVQRNFEPADAAQRAGESKELVVANVSITNTGSMIRTFNKIDLKVNEGGATSSPSLVVAPPALQDGNLSKGGVLTGNIIYLVDKDASNVKLQYQQVVYDLEKSESKVLTYSLGI